MMGKRWAILVLGLTCGACAPVYHPDAFGSDGSSYDLAATEGDGVVLLLGTRLRQQAEVLAIVEVQLQHDEYESGLERLATRATELGADAVVGVELTHGGVDGPSHLSGLAVRVLR